MPDYQKGKIYKIVNNENNNVYYGSTIQILSNRMSKHRNKHNLCMSKKIGVDIKECKIILVENYPCKSKYELEKRERYYIENFECVNKNIPTRTIKEWENDNKDKRKGYREKGKDRMKEYREKNKEEIKQFQKEYRGKNKDKMKEYREKGKDKMKEYNKEYREKNKEERKQKAKEYRQNNKEKIKCECGCIVLKSNLTRHKKTKKHCELIKSSS